LAEGRADAEGGAGGKEAPGVRGWRFYRGAGRRLGRNLRDAGHRDDAAVRPRVQPRGTRLQGAVPELTPSADSIEGQRRAVEILRPLDLDQHGESTFVGIALL